MNNSSEKIGNMVSWLPSGNHLLVSTMVIHTGGEPLRIIRGLPITKGDTKVLFSTNICMNSR